MLILESLKLILDSLTHVNVEIIHVDLQES